jgi:hypothetical protein
MESNSMTRHVIQSTHEDLATAIEQVGDGAPVLLECDGKPLFAIISMADLRLLEARMEELEDRIDREALQAAVAEPSDAVPYEEFRKELGL